MILLGIACGIAIGGGIVFLWGHRDFRRWRHDREMKRRFRGVSDPFKVSLPDPEPDHPSFLKSGGRVDIIKFGVVRPKKEESWN